MQTVFFEKVSIAFSNLTTLSSISFFFFYIAIDRFAIGIFSSALVISLLVSCNSSTVLIRSCSGINLVPGGHLASSSALLFSSNFHSFSSLYLLILWDVGLNIMVNLLLRNFTETFVFLIWDGISYFYDLLWFHLKYYFVKIIRYVVL